MKYTKNIFVFIMAVMLLAGNTAFAVTTISTNIATTGTITGTSASANALTVGLAGATNPALQVDASTTSSATGLKIKSAAAAGGLALSVISSGDNEALTINAKGSGAIGIGSASTGAVTITPATNVVGAFSVNTDKLSVAAATGVITLANGETIGNTANGTIALGGNYAGGGTLLGSTITENTAAADTTRYNSFVVNASTDPASSAEVSGVYGAYNWSAGTTGSFIANGVEGVARSTGADEAGTFRGGLFRTYTNGGTMRTAVGLEASARTAAATVAETGTAFVGARIWMAPNFTGGSVGNVNNFHGLWIYNETTDQKVTNAIKINDAGGTGGWTNGLNLGGATIGTADIVLSNGETIDNTSNDVVKITSPGITQAYDAAAYWTASQADAGGVNFNSVSDGTAGFSFSDPVQFGGSTTAGILHGAGATNQAGAISLGATGGKAMSYYVKSSSATTSHTLEGMYVTTYYGNDATSAAPYGEAGRFRAFLVGDAAAGTIAGSHDTVEMSAGGTNSGLTLGTRGNVIFPNEIVANAGTFAGVQAELNTGGAATDVSGTTTSILRLIIDGTAPTSAAQFTVPVISVVMPGNLVGNNLIFDDNAGTTTVTGKLRISINGTTYWLPIITAND